MGTAFISYSRHDKELVRTLVQDLTELGHQAWLDEQLSGGQVWWAQILEQVKISDFFVLAISPHSLKSAACQKEADWAQALNRPVLPILIGDVAQNLLPPDLASLQYVDFRKPTRESALRLARSLARLQTKPIPHPLPDPPEAPVSYLGGLQEEVESPSLGFDAQGALLLRLKTALENPDLASDARTVMMGLRRRPDVFASVAREIDRTLAGYDGTPAPPRPGDAPPTTRPALRRVRSALLGGVIGSVIGCLAALTLPHPSPGQWLLGLLTGLGAAIAGAITGMRARNWITAVGFGVLAWLIVVPGSGEQDAFAVGGVVGAPVGLVLGAGLSLLWPFKSRSPDTPRK